MQRHLLNTQKKIMLQLPEFIEQIIFEAIKQANKELTSYKQIKKFHIKK
jgi:hypothetical protein